MATVWWIVGTSWHGARLDADVVGAGAADADEGRRRPSRRALDLDLPAFSQVLPRVPGSEGLIAAIESRLILLQEARPGAGQGFN